MESAIQLVVSQLRGAVVGPVDLAVAAGSCAAIGGASGAGKSLLLRMIADLVPNDGDVRLGEHRRAGMAAPAWRRQVVYVGAASWWAPTVAAHFSREDAARARTMAARLGLSDDHFERPVATLSTGEAQRLVLVRAFVRRPKVLLLDEPTSALDEAGVGRVESLLREILASGVVLVLVTHDVAQAARLADARYLMAAGRLSPA